MLLKPHNALDAKFSQYKTNEYYNNSFSSSMKRLGANVMESAFFTKRLTDHILFLKRIIIILWIVSFFIIWISFSNIDWSTTIARLIFSAEIAVEWLKIEFLRSRCKKIYEGLEKLFEKSKKDNTMISQSAILRYFANYEAAKSSSGVWILYSEKDFNQNPKLNQKFTAEWKQIWNKLFPLE